MKRVSLILLLAATAALAQAPTGQNPESAPGTSPGPRGRMMRQFEGAGGEITEMHADGFTLRTFQGKTQNVKVTSSTEYRKGQQGGKLSDFKVGDTVMVAGKTAGDDLVADRVIDRSEQMKRFREGLGKEFVTGQVTAINDTKVTVLRPDQQTQTFEVDENTSFRKQRESITLADIKPGDRIFARGQLKDNVFVASEVSVGGPGGPGPMMMERREQK